MSVSPSPETILSVLALTRLIKGKLERGFPAVWVRGEVSGCKRHPSSGHLYFSLKEGTAAVLSCAMYRTENQRLTFEPREGMEVEAFGRVTVYEPRGGYQLAIEAMRPAGLGAMLLALEELKRKLQAEGLFDPRRKRLLPRFPGTVGLVTSSSGAAVQDLIKVLRSRWPSIRIVIDPVRVQGEGAAAEIARAIRRFDRFGEADVLIVGRGGGSLEDLWAFNEEPVVRAIAESRAPVISAVGHEVDTTLADLVADVRAATPSNAAELAVPERREVALRVRRLLAQSSLAIGQRLARHRRHLDQLIAGYGFRRHRDVIDAWRQRLDDRTDRMRDALRGLLSGARERMAAAIGRYGWREFPRGLAARREQGEALGERLARALGEGLRDRRRRAGAAADRLRALSPRLVLERGYCLARGTDGRLLRAAAQLTVGERLTLEFARGEADTRVEAVRPGEGHAS
jgi:exodeoxyribonuclease VII large subunit